MQTVLSILSLDVVGFFALLCVFMAMAGLGAGTNPARLNLSRPDLWRVAATVALALVAVPLVTLLVARSLDLRSAALVGILLVGISPGAPLALRKSRESGGEAGFSTVLQVTVALLSIVAVPAWIVILGVLYGREAGISLAILAKQVFIAQILPLACGIALAFWTPAFAKRIASPLLRASNILLLVVAVLIVSQVWRALLGEPVHAAIASIVITGSALAMGHWACGPSRETRTAGAVICALRNPGIALLVASANGFPEASKVVILAHVLITAIMLIVYLTAMKHFGPSPGPLAPA
jgi:BASS family bile acid:Na+ symporter